MKKNKKSFFPLVIMALFIVHSNSCIKNAAKFNTNVTYGTMTDQEGNVYKTVTIGNQTWMAENLRTTKYNDGTAIPLVINNDEWSSLSTGAYCSYNNTSIADSIANYGLLYNWYAVNTGILAPKGWHVPTDAEWSELTDYLGGEIAACAKLKETGASHWIDDEIATNETGFTALPGGFRGVNGSFSLIGIFSFWWSTTMKDDECVWGLQCGSNNFKDYYGKVVGISVRCIKDY